MPAGEMAAAVACALKGQLSTYNSLPAGAAMQLRPPQAAPAPGVAAGRDLLNDAQQPSSDTESRL